MIKKIFLVVLIIAFFIAGIIWFKFFTPKTGFKGKHKFLYVYSGKATKEAVLESVEKDTLVTNTWDFLWLANRAHYWDNVRPGKYAIKKGETVFSIMRKLRNGTRTPVDLIITKLRLPEDFARLAGRNFEADSANFMAYLDSAGYDKYYKIIPNTYTFAWTAKPASILKKLNDEYDAWWKQGNRLQKAEASGYTTGQLYTIASIVEEETNRPDDKQMVSSVYFNRLKKGMPLQADPTLRFALRDFNINRIYNTHKEIASPYNTYKNTGLPPGPICTPSTATLDSVLNAPKTDYIYFVANPDLKGGSIFTTEYAQHIKWAHIYQDSLTAWQKRKAAKKAVADSLAQPKKQ